MKSSGSRNSASVRKPYEQPRLVTYGDLAELTRNVGPKGVPDGGGGAAAGPKTGV